MKWEKCKLIGKIQIGVDPLNNPTWAKEVVCTFQGRLTQWSAEDVATLGYDFTSTHRKLLTKLHPEAIRGDKTEWNTFNFETDSMKEFENTTIEVGGAEYNIDSLIDLEPRYRLLYISAYKL